MYCVECMSELKQILSVIHYTIYGAVCFQFTHLPCDDWENIITHCLGLGHETLVCAVCLSIFLCIHNLFTVTTTQLN